MADVLVDSCVILDIVTEDPIWYDWSAETLEKYANHHQLMINPIIYVEVSMGYEKIESLETALHSTVFKRTPLPWEAAFLAGKAFLHHRKSGGQRTIPLSDFFIGAHAAVSNFQLMTREKKRFKYYYPKIKIISPE